MLYMNSTCGICIIDWRLYCCQLGCVDIEQDSDPSDGVIEIAVTVGDDVLLSCTSQSREPVYWVFQRDMSDDFTEISIHGTVFDNFRLRYSLSEQALLIRNVTLSDAGLYHCIEDNGLGRWHNATTLIVTGILASSLDNNDIQSET